MLADWAREAAELGEGDGNGMYEVAFNAMVDHEPWAMKLLKTRVTSPIESGEYECKIFCIRKA